MKKNYSLKIEQVPAFPFIHSFFEITVDLIDDQSGLLKCGEEVPIEVKLQSESEDKSEVLELSEKDPKISMTGFTKIKIKILEPSMRFDNKEYTIHVSTKEASHKSIASAQSEGMFAISHQLIIDGGHVPKNWFKDRGGKDSFIELGVSMISSTKKLVTHRRVPLKVTLLYENEEPVANQNILAHSTDTKLQIDSTGRTYIRFRINEVSRNHQKQSFCLKIGPDVNKYPLNNDISPVLSDCVEVLSKPRSGKDKKEEPILNGKRKVIEGSAELPSNSKKEKRESASMALLPEASGITALLNAHSMSAAKSSEVETFPNSGSKGGVDNVKRQHDARQAFADLMQWTKMVMDELLQLKWRQVGVERMPDGTTEPLIVRKNPNLAIEDLVTRYNEYAVPNMRMLYKDIFSVDEKEIPDTKVSSDDFEAQGTSIDDLPPCQSAPKFGQQHSLMSNPDDWPGTLFTPSVMEVIGADSVGNGKDEQRE